MANSVTITVGGKAGRRLANSVLANSVLANSVKYGRRLANSVVASGVVAWVVSLF